MIRFSVIVPVYKTEKFLNECIDSILANQLADMEIILVDDGSPDNCGKVCDSYAQKYNNIKVIHKENGGLSSARNAGLDIAQGDYLAFVDSDDMVDSEMFTKMLHQIALQRADVGCCGMKILGTEMPYQDYTEWADVYDHDDCIQLLLSCNGTGDFYANKIFRRELFSNVRLPKGKYYEDIFSMYKIFDKAEKVICFREPLYHYRLYSESISHSSVFTPKIMDFAYACREEWRYVKTNREEYFDLATAKYANAINLLSKKHSLIYGKCTEAKKCFQILIDMFLEDIKTIENNEYCSERLKYEVSLMMKSKHALKKYLRKLNIYQKMHNHPSLQRRLHRLWHFPIDKELKSFQY